MTESRYKYKELFTPSDGIFKYMTDPLDIFNLIERSELDTMFYYKYGNKKVTAIVSELVEDGKLSSENKRTIAQVVSDFFNHKWNKLYSVFTEEYDTTAITSYTEVINTSDSGSRTNNDTNKTYGFNSSDGVNDTSSQSTETTGATGSKTRTFTGRSGIFPQTVLEAEIKLRQKNLLLDYVLADVNTIINLKIY